MKGGGESEGKSFPLASAGVRYFEQMLAFFAYKPDDQAMAMPTHGPPLLRSRASLEPTRRSHQKPEHKPHVSGGKASHANVNGDGEEQSGPATPEPMQSGGTKKNKRKRRNEEESPSSYIRATVDGKPVLVSRFFPLPPTASSPVVLSRHEVERARRRARHNAKRPILALPKKKRSDGKEDGNDGDGKRKKKKSQKRSQRTQLPAAEKKLDAYRRVGEDNMWEPPASCHNLLQERHSFDPWRVLIICMLLNITGGKQVRKVLPGLFLLCPDAETAAKVPVEEIEKVIQTLGLQKKRAKTIKRFSQEYLDPKWTHVTQLHGVGKYAADAYAIFCVGKPKEVIPEDHKLIDYWKFVCGKEGKGEISSFGMY